MADFVGTSGFGCMFTHWRSQFTPPPFFFLHLLLVTPHHCYLGVYRPRPTGSTLLQESPQVSCTRQARGSPAKDYSARRQYFGTAENTEKHLRYSTVASWKDTDCETSGTQCVSCSPKRVRFVQAGSNLGNKNEVRKTTLLHIFLRFNHVGSLLTLKSMMKKTKVF